MTRTIRIALAALVCVAASAAASAQDCTTDKTEPFDLTETKIVALYDCIKDRMADGYANQGDPIEEVHVGN